MASLTPMRFYMLRIPCHGSATFKISAGWGFHFLRGSRSNQWCKREVSSGVSIHRNRKSPLTRAFPTKPLHWPRKRRWHHRVLDAFDTRKCDGPLISAEEVDRLIPHGPRRRWLRKEGFTDHCMSKDPAVIANNSLVAPHCHLCNRDCRSLGIIPSECLLQVWYASRAGAGVVVCCQSWYSSWSGLEVSYGKANKSSGLFLKWGIPQRPCQCGTSDLKWFWPLGLGS